MDEFVGVLLGVVAAVVNALARAAIDALARRAPGVAQRTVAQVAVGRGETAYTVLAAGILAAVERPPAEVRRQLGGGDAEDLPVQDMADALAPVGDDLL